jgi:hypothetical protein
VNDRDVTCIPDDYTVKLMTEVERLQGENTKLRELVHGLNYCCSSRRKFVSCERCPLYDVTAVNIEPKCDLMMRELGIEVKTDET